MFLSVCFAYFVGNFCNFRTACPVYFLLEVVIRNSDLNYCLVTFLSKFCLCLASLFSGASYIYDLFYKGPLQRQNLWHESVFSSQLDSYEIKPGKTLKVNISVPNLRLFVGNIPKSRGKEEILEEFGKLTGKVKKQTEGVG